MEKIKVLVIIGHEDLKFDIKGKLSHEDIAFLGFAKYGDSVVEKALSFMPNAIILVNGQDEYNALRLAKEIYVSLPGCAIMLLSDKIDLPFLEKAMQAGVRKVLDENIGQDLLIESIKQGCQMEWARIKNNNSAMTKVSSQIITVFGAKGGIGKSTIVANLAAALARKGKRVAILDLDLQFGDINLFFDVEPKDTIAELVQDKQAFDIETIKSYMYLHSSTVNILCAPQSPELAEVVQGQSVEKIINTIRPYFDYVLIDTPPYFTESCIVAIENSDKVLQVVTLDISTLRNTKISLDIFESLQQKEKVTILVNREASGIISVKDAQNILDYHITYRVSSDWKTAIASLNRGVPIVMDAPRSILSKEFFEIAESLAGKEIKKKKNK